MVLFAQVRVYVCAGAAGCVDVGAFVGWGGGVGGGVHGCGWCAYVHANKGWACMGAGECASTRTCVHAHVF